jgi:hypothetical protein
MVADGDDDDFVRFKDFPVKKYEARHGEDYTFEASISDLVDNSIDSNATFVEVIITEQNFDATPKQYIEGLTGNDNFFALIIDNGKGIQPDQFVAAMSDGYDRGYDETELGAFGVGMKASSLAQAYEVTVMSKIKGGDPITYRLSSCLVNKHEKERLWREKDLLPWMIDSRGFNLAKKKLAELDHGTIVLMEGLHMLELEVGEKHARKHYTDRIKTRVKNYLGLVFHYYINKTKVPRSDGTLQERSIDLYFGGRKKANKILPLDPFGQQWYDGYSGDSKGTLCISKKFTTQVNSEPRDVVAKLWILPHPNARDGRIDMQNRMKTVRENASIIKLQGTYIYRNRRLIHFAHGDKPWSEMMKPQDHLVYSRAEIHLPPCKPNEKRKFSINTSKTEVNLGKSLREDLRYWASKPGKKWHSKDPVKKSFKQRGILRDGNDSNWPKCTYCKDNSIKGATTHTYASCLQRPTCEFCRKNTHGSGVPLTREFCKKVAPCDICGTKIHDTINHGDSSGQPTTTPPTTTPTTTTTTPPTTNPIPEFPKKYTDKGPLIESVDEDDDKLPTIRINRKHKYYDKLRDLLRE